MKLLASTVLLGAAAAVPGQQQVLQNPFKHVSNPIPDSWTKPLNSLAHAMEGMTDEGKKIWDEVAMLFPEALDQATFFSQPKPAVRRPDSKWDYIMKGVDVQNIWVDKADGELEREIDGKLENYNLRAKKVDPSKLGVDTVKQYSGYLDDEEEDKHLFYCKLKDPSSSCKLLLI